MRRLRQKVGRRRRDDDQVRRPRELDVIEGVPGAMSAECTGRPVSASKVTAPTNSCAERVSTTSTSAPACVSKRASATLL